MKDSRIVFSILLTCYFAGCTKTESKTDAPTDEFSFTYNGTKYNYSITGNVSNAGVGKGIDGTPYISIDMVDVFGAESIMKKRVALTLNLNSLTTSALIRGVCFRLAILTQLIQ